MHVARRFAVLVIIFFAASPLWAQKPDPGQYSPEKFDVLGVRGIKFPMRDGVKLSADIYRPISDDKFPAILIMTPYSNNGPGMITRAKWFARRGYAVVMTDSRGRFDSDGEFDPFSPLHKTDGYDTVEWVAKQPWCDGKVGTLGPSYMGWTQWWTAVMSPPSLKAMVPEVAPPDGVFNGPYQNGVLVCWAVDWAGAMSGRTGQYLGDGPYGGFAANREKDYAVLPYATLLDRRGAADNMWYAKWMKQNTMRDAYWKDISYQTPEHYAKVNVPTLNVTGWFDANHTGSPMNYLGVKQYGGTDSAKKPRLMIGAWQHSINTQKVGTIDYGPDNLLDWDGYVCRYFDHHLKGVANGLDQDPPVSLFMMGENKWRTATDWPLPETKFTKFYLHSGGKANSLNGDGSLDTTTPKDEPADKYAYDPQKPTPSPYKGGHTEDGAVDTKDGASRDDVLVYATAPLEKDVTLIGPVSAKLFAATSAKDTDWMIRLVDVAPDGTAQLLCDAAMRARHRDPAREGKFHPHALSTIEPDAVLEYTLDFWRGTANRFAAGHRIRVEISSSFSPYFLPNLNTGEDFVGLQTRPVIAKQTIYHDAKRASHIVLPVIEE